MLSLTDENDWVFDPFMGVGSSLVAAIRHGRRGVGCDIMSEYLTIARKRIHMQLSGDLKTRPMNRPVYDPKAAGNSLTISPWAKPVAKPSQLKLLESRKRYLVK